MLRMLKQMIQAFFTVCFVLLAVGNIKIDTSGSINFVRISYLHSMLLII